MAEQQPYRKPLVTKIVRELTPPLFWNLLQRAVVRPANGEAGSERPDHYYDAAYAESEEYRRHYADSKYFFLWCVLIDRIQPAQVRCLLDIGCGPGQLASFLRDRGLAKYVGIDFSHECIRMATSVCPNFEFLCHDAFTSEVFDTLNYDVAIATEFLEHVDADLVILDRIRPGTRMYGSLPNFPHPAHVRHFNSAKEVYERYSSRFTGFRVDEFPFGSGGMSFFVFEGVRAETQAAHPTDKKRSSF
jgi:SAM-dependent methyltransferase